MSRFEHSVDINVPLCTVYNQWTQFEEYPAFMEGVQSIKRTSENVLHWVAHIGGRVQEWDSEIVEWRPATRMAWQKTSGFRHAGVVSFHPINDSVTRVVLQIDYEPDGLVEHVGTALSTVEQRLTGDLERFKVFIEERSAGMRRFQNNDQSEGGPVMNNDPGEKDERGERNVLGDDSFVSPENTDSIRREKGRDGDNWYTSDTPTEPEIPEKREDLGNSDIAPGDEPAHSFGAVEDEPQNKWDMRRTSSNTNRQSKAS